MNKKKKDLIFNISAIVIFLILVYFLLIPKGDSNINEEVARCIGENSFIYVQTGCSHCEDQLAMFQNYTKYLHQIDCVYEPEKSGGITGTPTWKIENKLYPGVQEIKTLKGLTGC